jgi:hypothetical protein
MTVQLERDIPSDKDDDDPPLPVPMIKEVKARFNFGPTPIDTQPTGAHKVRSEYVEEQWLAYIGPTALLVARRMDNALSTVTTQGCNVSQWSKEMGITPEELMRALNRLARFGLGEWQGDQTFLLRRHWPSVPLAIATQVHREALLTLAD